MFSLAQSQSHNAKCMYLCVHRTHSVEEVLSEWEFQRESDVKMEASKEIERIAQKASYFNQCQRKWNVEKCLLLLLLFWHRTL